MAGEGKVAVDTSLRDRMASDLKDAMRSGDATTRDVIRFVLAAVKNAEIEKGGALTPEEERALLRRHEKQRHESIEQFKAGKRDDLVERETAQLAVLERYLPPAMNDAELKALAKQVVAELGASGPRDMSKVMPVLIERAGGRADGRRLSAAAREALGTP